MMGLSGGYGSLGGLGLQGTARFRVYGFIPYSTVSTRPLPNPRIFFIIDILFLVEYLNNFRDNADNVR